MALSSLSAPDWETVYSEFVNYHDTAYRLVDEAITFTEQEQYAQAVSKYEEGLINIDKALQLSVECPSNADSRFQRACDMIQHLKMIRKNVVCQIGECHTKLSEQQDAAAPPPSYEEVMSNAAGPSAFRSYAGYTEAASTITDSTMNTNRTGITYAELGSMLENLKLDISAQSAQLVLTCDNVKVYYVSSSGIVTATMEPDTLRIFEIEDGTANNLPKYYLQIGSYLYPLLPNVSPCLRAEYGAILLPNVDGPGSADVIGLVIPEDSEEFIINFLENVLHIKLSRPAPPKAPEEEEEPRLSTKLSDYITSGASVLSKGLVSGAHMAEQFIETNTPKLIEKLNPSQEKYVSPKFRKGIRVARNVTSRTADITGFVATQVGAATMCLGKYLAPHVKKGGTKLISSTTGVAKDEASRKMEDVLTVTAGAVEGLAEIYNALEQSALLLGRTLTSNTTEVIKHRYGPSAAEVTEDTLYTVGNSMQIGNNIRVFKPNNLIKHTAKGTFKAENTAASPSQSSSPTFDFNKGWGTLLFPPSSTSTSSSEKTSPVGSETTNLSSVVKNGSVTSDCADRETKSSTKSSDETKPTSGLEEKEKKDKQ